MTNILIIYCEENYNEDHPIIKCDILKEIPQDLKQQIFRELLAGNPKLLEPVIKSLGYFQQEEIKKSKDIKFSNKDSVEFRCGSYTESVSQDGKLSAYFLDRIYNSGGSACFVRIPIPDAFAAQINEHKQKKDAEKEKRKRKKEEKAIEKARIILAKSEKTQ